MESSLDHSYGWFSMAAVVYDIELYDSEQVMFSGSGAGYLFICGRAGNPPRYLVRFQS